MRLRIIILLSCLVAIVCTAPIDDDEKDDIGVTTTVEPVTEISTSEPEEVPTTLQPETDDVDGDERKARQLDEEDDDDDDVDQEDDDDDDEEEEDADEEEEEERKLPGGRVNAKPAPKKKASQVERKTKPVPVLVEGVEDDEAEDLGIFEREDSKNGSNEKSDEDKSDEEKADDDNEDEDDDDDDDESGEDDDDQDESESTGLVDDPSSNERGDVDDISVSAPIDNAVAANNQEPLAIAVVQPEVEVSDPVVPIIVEESSKNQVGQSQPSKKADKSRKNKPKKEEEDDEDEDDDDEDDDDDDDDEPQERSEKITKARSAYSSPVLYYYPFPESQVE